MEKALSGPVEFIPVQRRRRRKKVGNSLLLWGITGEALRACAGTVSVWAGRAFKEGKESKHGE